MSRGGSALMGKRALITQVKHITNREGFIVDPFWGSGGTPQPVQQFSAEIEQGGRERLRLALGLSVQHLMGDDVLEEELEEGTSCMRQRGLKSEWISYRLGQLELSDGELERFEMTAEQLQDLRYDVARALKEMQDLEESQAVRLAAGQPHPAARATPSKTAPTPTASPAAAPPRVIPASAASAAATAAPAAAAAAAPPSDLPSF